MGHAHIIMIVTGEQDAHVDAVIVALRRMGQNPIRLHPADFPLKAQVTLALEGKKWGGHIDLLQGSLELERICSVWWRKPTSSVLPAELSAEERAYAQRETAETLSGVWNLLDCYWMNFPPCNRRASNKIDQLRRAAQLGFAVPRTLVTNDPEQARAFYEICEGKIIYKNMGSPILGEQSPLVVQGKSLPSVPRIVYTTALSPEHVGLLEAVRTAPCQFQELVAKRYELRITIIGDDLFACEIHSQEHERTRMDWRHYDVTIPYRKGTLPPDIADKCFALTKGYGLNFAAIDMIVTPEGEYIFLELNPNGQWLFIEQIVPELKMLDALTACLVRGGA